MSPKTKIKKRSTSKRPPSPPRDPELYRHLIKKCSSSCRYCKPNGDACFPGYHD